MSESKKLRGFSLSDDTRNIIVGLYNTHVLGHSDSRNFTVEDKVLVVQLARHIFSEDLGKWVNNKLHMGYTPEFLSPVIEVQDAIKNGGRGIDLLYWTGLIELYDGTTLWSEKNYSAKSITETYKSFEYLRGTTVLAWAQMPNGIVDILCTLYIYYGHTGKID